MEMEFCVVFLNMYPRCGLENKGGFFVFFKIEVLINRSRFQKFAFLGINLKSFLKSYIIVLLTNLRVSYLLVEPLPEIENFMWLVMNDHPNTYSFLQKYIFSIKSFKLKIFCGLQLLKNEVIGPKIKGLVQES